jgi:hypothetical protein
VLAYFGVLALIAVVLVAWDGVITVRVREKTPGGHLIYVAVPGIMIPVALHFIPARYFRGAHDAQLRLVLPAVEGVINSLSNISDTVLVEVASPGSHVIVRKLGRSVVTDVNDDDADVHVSVPLRAIRATACAIAAKVSAVDAADPPDSTASVSEPSS